LESDTRIVKLLRITKLEKVATM